ncbi:MAG: ATP-binding protein [Acidimicrobiia bacterium]
MALIREHQLVRLLREVDVFIARELAGQMAEGGGFDSYQSADIETAVSELCSNALRYGRRGWAILRISPIAFEAVITDEGPGFESAPETKSGLGVGLAGAGRLMDHLSIQPMPVGSRVTIKKQRPEADSSLGSSYEWEMSVVNRRRTGRSVSGDKWHALPHEDTLTVVVVDGLGSGERAAEASTVVVDNFIAQEQASPLDEMVVSFHDAARETRGVVGMITRINGPELEYCGFGDVGGRVEPAGETLILQHGILGVEITEPVVRRLPWAKGSRLALWTDGLRPPVDVLSHVPDGPELDDWIDDLALGHGTELDDGLLLLATQTKPVDKS